MLLGPIATSDLAKSSRTIELDLQELSIKTWEQFHKSEVTFDKQCRELISSSRQKLEARQKGIPLLIEDTIFRLNVFKASISQGVHCLILNKE